jgi:hypothetical protein
MQHQHGDQNQSNHTHKSHVDPVKHTETRTFDHFLDLQNLSKLHHFDQARHFHNSQQFIRTTAAAKHQPKRDRGNKIYCEESFQVIGRNSAILKVKLAIRQAIGSLEVHNNVYSKKDVHYLFSHFSVLVFWVENHSIGHESHAIYDQKEH